MTYVNTRWEYIKIYGRATLGDDERPAKAGRGRVFVALGSKDEDGIHIGHVHEARVHGLYGASGVLFRLLIWAGRGIYLSGPDDE